MAPLRSYTIKFKLEVLEFLCRNSVEATSRKFGIHPKTVRDWRKKKVELNALVTDKKISTSTRKRLSGGGRKRISPKLDWLLMDCILDMRRNGLRVSRKMIQAKARELISSLDSAANAVLKASNGWVQKFMKRSNLSVRRKTTLAQKDPEKLHEKIVSLIMHTSKVKTENRLKAKDLIAMDETSLWFDMISNTTVEPTGSKSVMMKSTGNEKAHATVVLAAKRDGTKLKPYVIFKKSVRDVKTMQGLIGVVVASSNNGWMNTVLTKDWLDKVYGKFSSTHRALIWDSYKCHISDEVKGHLSHFNTSMIVIPGGCTKYIQAPDVAWNKPFKVRLTEYHDKWLAGEENKQYTKGGGNLKAPALKVLVDWVKDAWNSLPLEMIKASFMSCGITTADDGSQDCQITCLKDGNPCSPAKLLLRVSRVKKQFEQLELLEDEEQADLNEALIDSEEEEGAKSGDEGEEESDGEGSTEVEDGDESD